MADANEKSAPMDWAITITSSSIATRRACCAHSLKPPSFIVFGSKRSIQSTEFLIHISPSLNSGANRALRLTNAALASVQFQQPRRTPFEAEGANVDSGE
jgi:hypothetical protein